MDSIFKPFINQLRASVGNINRELESTLHQFIYSYIGVAISHGFSKDDLKPILEQFAHVLAKQIEKPYQFKPYHKALTSPFDYYQFGIDFIKPLIDLKNSTISGRETLAHIASELEKKENIILFANHQIEADPQVISILLEKQYPELAKDMIFVAGNRVLDDPLAAPFSMGRNLLCVFSKKYIDTDPKAKAEKLAHNQITMKEMAKLLDAGSCCIYVAPSGGRDRPGSNGVVEVAEFDPKSIELFHMIAKRSRLKTHFYPLSLATYSVLPPPNSIQSQLGEVRSTQGGACHLYFGKKLDFDSIENNSTISKHDLRKMKAKVAHQVVNDNYQSFQIDY